MTGILQIGRIDLPATGIVEPVDRVGIETELLRATVRRGGRNRDETDCGERRVTLLASDTDAGTRRRFEGGGLVRTGVTDPSERGVTPDE